MKKSKKNHSKEKYYPTSAKMINQWKKGIVHDCMILSSAYLMEEKEFSDDRILEYWDKLSEWVLCVKEHLLTIEHVVKIINEHTGMNLHYNYVEEAEPVNKYAWHNLIFNAKDLPEEDTEVLVIFGNGKHEVNTYSNGWQKTFEYNPVAWKYIEG